MEMEGIRDDYIDTFVSYVDSLRSTYSLHTRGSYHFKPLILLKYFCKIEAYLYFEINEYILSSIFYHQAF